MTAHKCEGPAGGPTPQDNTQNAWIVTDLDAGRKAYVTLQARAALAGFQLHELAGGELLLTRWGLAKSCPDLYSVGRFLDQVTGVR